ncbi:MAG: hypothetical protein E6R03_09325 [Hyphomicrobiaceae bacterium]|nr:MAG: hypothetical protein E6R03_09325 [Hyphomicrobiaceae bacterium]
MRFLLEKIGWRERRKFAAEVQPLVELLKDIECPICRMKKLREIGFEPFAPQGPEPNNCDSLDAPPLKRGKVVAKISRLFEPLGIDHDMIAPSVFFFRGQILEKPVAAMEDKFVFTLQALCEPITDAECDEIDNTEFEISDMHSGNYGVYNGTLAIIDF